MSMDPLESHTTASGPAKEQAAPGALPPDPGLIELFAATTAESGRSLLALLDEQPMLLVFLRHFGSLWTRETLSRMAAAAPALERRGVRPVFIHMAAPQKAAPYFERYGLTRVERAADPERRLYTAPVFHLLKTTGVKEFLTPKAYWKLAKRSLLRHGIGLPGEEDATQLPGVFFLKGRAIYRAFRPKRISDRVDYARFGA
jgi:hypothetical protein